MNVTARSLRISARRILFFSVILLLVGVAASQARVYWNWRGAAHVDELLATLGGAALYQSEATVNGVPGRLSVRGFESILSDVVSQLDRRLDNGEPGGWRRATGLDGVESGQRVRGSMVLGTVTEAGMTTRLLVMTVAPERTLVLTFQAEARLLESGHVSSVDVNSPNHLPLYPGGTTQFHALLEESGMEWLSVDAPVDPATLRNHLQEALVADGWSGAAGEALAETDGFACFARGGANCWLWVIPSEEGLHSTAALLYRKALGEN